MLSNSCGQGDREKRMDSEGRRALRGVMGKEGQVERGEVVQEIKKKIQH